MEKITEIKKGIDQQYKGWEKDLCGECQKMLLDTMTPLYEDINSKNPVVRGRARIKLAALNTTLYKKYCSKCLNMLKARLNLK